MSASLIIPTDKNAFAVCNDELDMSLWNHYENNVNILKEV